MLLNAARREGWYAAASTHPPAVRLVTAEPLRLRPPAVRLATAEPPRLRSARARREGGLATHPPAVGWSLPSPFASYDEHA